MNAVLALLLCGAASAAPTARTALLRVEGAGRALASVRQESGTQAERRGYELSELGRKTLGPGFSVAESSEVLGRMAAWLASQEARRAGAALSGEDGARRLLEQAARRAHPAISRGAGSRGARNWTEFVIGAASLRPEAPAGMLALKDDQGQP